MIKCGGTSPAVEADDRVQSVCDKVKASLEGKVGHKFNEYKALTVTKQVVAGTNYFVKIHIGNEEYIHVRIFHPLPGQGDPEVHSYQLDKTKEDEVEFF
ncbi:hypothetical protein LSH36_164g06010 [Paralvinella palmiformis]|uniref:Cystatin domain-containing protein n=1 Tax=Paralvinella palmiformis TaxID=53620 RepID=A0AAD9JTC7_9ANNE|nr:hypothetical protein LSH36_164g06010 [Paralvinella palmiformis]